MSAFDLSRVVYLPELSAWAYDAAKDQLVMTTSSGSVIGWGLGDELWKFRLELGYNATSVAVSADGQTTLVGNGVNQLPTSPDQLTRVDLNTQSVTNIYVPNEQIVMGAYDTGVAHVAVASNGMALFITDKSFGYSPIHEFNLTASSPSFGAVLSTVPSVSASVPGSSFLLTSDDHRYVLVEEAHLLPGRIDVYDAVADKIIASGSLSVFGSASLNRGEGDITDQGGGFVVDVADYDVYLFDLHLNPVADLHTRADGAQFSPDGNQVFLWQGTRQKVVVIDTHNFQQIGTLDVVSSITNQSAPSSGHAYGQMDVVDGGRVLVLDTGSGLEFVDLAVHLKTTVSGDASNEALHGTIGFDSIFGGAGDDLINGGGRGQDTLFGGDGNDVIQGGADFDRTNGNQGDDTVHGAAGDDWVTGGQRQDVLFGDDGNDILNGNLGNDTGDGGAGDDTVRGGQGGDLLSGGDGNDYLTGDLGDDTMTGGPGADTFRAFAGGGHDVITDFNAAEGDRIVLDLGTTYTASQSGDDVVLDLGGGGQMILQNVQLSALPPNWIFEA